MPRCDLSITASSKRLMSQTMYARSICIPASWSEERNTKLLSPISIAREKKAMNHRRLSAVVLSTVLWFAYGATAAAPTEIKGAAILDHPCGKVAVKQMELAHEG